MDGEMLKKIIILNTRSLSNYHNALPMSILSRSSDQNDAVSITQPPPDLHRQLLSSLTDDSDFDFAFRLQLDEALAASASASPYFVISDFAATLNLNQSNSLDDVLRSINRFHNSKKKKDRENGEGSSLSGEVFRVYFKGILAEERVRDGGGNLVPKFAGIGVAVCDSSDQVLFEVKKPVAVSGGGGGEWIMNNRVVAVKALIEGLNAALSLGLERVVFYCDYYPLYQFVTRRWKPKQHNLAILLNQVKLLRKKFTFCKLSFVGGNDAKFAFQLAREAIISQAGSSSKVESCVICLEDKDVDMIFSVDGCVHRYCFSCMKQHVEVKLLHGMVPKCPHEGCTAELIIDSCKKFLTPKLIEIMGQRLTEASIPVTEKMYCPYPKCSALMSRSEVLEYSKTIFSNADNSGVRKCIKCHGLFCVNCKVPWHSSMTCDEYRIDNPNPHAEDVKLKNLAAKNLWRQCVKCNHMIELVAGCYHMTCRCGCEFCYTCGAEWKDKKPSCNCPLWDNEHIIDDDDEEDEDDFDEEDDDSEDYYETDSDEY